MFIVNTAPCDRGTQNKFDQLLIKSWKEFFPAYIKSIIRGIVSHHNNCHTNMWLCDVFCLSSFSFPLWLQDAGDVRTNLAIWQIINYYSLITLEKNKNCACIARLAWHLWYKQECRPKVVGGTTVPQRGLQGNSHNALGGCEKAPKKNSKGRRFAWGKCWGNLLTMPEEVVEDDEPFFKIKSPSWISQCLLQWASFILFWNPFPMKFWKMWFKKKLSLRV